MRPQFLARNVEVVPPSKASPTAMAKRKRGPWKPSNPGLDSTYEEKGASQLNINSYEDVADSEDEFHLGRDKVLLEDEAVMKRQKKRQQDEGKF